MPFLDNDLVDFAMRLPVRFKLCNLSEVLRIDENKPGDKQGKYFKQTRDGKRLLRKVVGRYIPAEISNATKQGFSAPDASWFKGESIDFVRCAILDRRARLYEYLDWQTVYDLVDEHLQGKENRRLLIWSLLSFELWLRQFLD